MSLTGFNRLRRMKQEEAMKPENIIKEQPIIEKIEEPVESQIIPVDEELIIEEIKEEPIIEEKSTSTRRRRRN